MKKYRARSKSLTFLSSNKDLIKNNVNKTKSLEELFKTLDYKSDTVRPRFSSKLENKKTSIGGFLIFKCSFNGSLPFQISWFKNNIKIKENERFKTYIQSNFNKTFLTGLIDYEVKLKISKCSKEDFGRYKVLVKTKYGNIFCSAILGKS